MYNIRGYKDAFLKGVDEFMCYACEKTNLSNEKIRCPYSKCKNLKFFHFQEIKVHLYNKGFIPEYWYWTCHGESDPNLCVDTVEPSGVQALKNPNPLKDDEGWLCLLLLSCPFR